MPTPDPTSNRKIPRLWQPRFGLGGLLLVMLVCSVMAAAGSYFFRSIREGRELQLSFILFTLAAPPLLVVLVSFAFRLTGQLAQRRSQDEDK